MCAGKIFMNTKCDRCGPNPQDRLFRSTIDALCSACLEEECRSPDYPRATAVEHEVVRYGERTFPWHQMSKERGESEMRGKADAIVNCQGKCTFVRVNAQRGA